MYYRAHSELMDTIDGADRRITYVKSKIRGYLSTEEHVRILLSKRARTFGGIQKELQAMEVKIGKRGLHKIIDRLRTREIIEKVPANPYPLYCLTTKSVNDFGLRANIFQDSAVSVVLNSRSSIIKGKKETVIKKIVEIGGLFNVYSYLVTLDFTGNQQQVEEKWLEWFDNIGTPIDLIIWLEDYLVTFWPESEKKPDVNRTLQTGTLQSRTLQRTLNKKAAQKFKKILYTLYPNEMMVYDTKFQKLEEQVKNFHKLAKKQSMDSMK